MKAKTFKYFFISSLLLFSQQSLGQLTFGFSNTTLNYDQSKWSIFDSSGDKDFKSYMLKANGLNDVFIEIYESNTPIVFEDLIEPLIKQFINYEEGIGDIKESQEKVNELIVDRIEIQSTEMILLIQYYNSNQGGVYFSLYSYKDNLNFENSNQSWQDIQTFYNSLRPNN